MVGPAPVNPVRKTVIVDAGDHYTTGTFDWWRRTVHFDAAVVVKNDTAPAVGRAREHPDVQAILVWARFPYYEIASSEAGTRVTIRDVRFGDRVGATTVTVSALSSSLHAARERTAPHHGNCWPGPGKS